MSTEIYEESWNQKSIDDTSLVPDRSWFILQVSWLLSRAPRRSLATQIWSLDAHTRNVVLPFTVTRSVTIREMSKVVASRDTNLVFGEFSRGRGSGFNLCPLIADDIVKDLILPRKRLENGLRTI